MMSHPNWPRRATVWRGTWGERCRGEGIRPWSAFLFSGSESPVWVFWVSHNTRQRLLRSHEPWSRPTIPPFDPKTQLPWLCRQTVLFWNFAAWAKRNAATHVIVVWSQVWSGTPRFRHLWQSNPNVVIFVCVALKKFAWGINALPLVVFCEHVWDPSCAHLPIFQLFSQSPTNGASRNLRNQNADIIESDPPILTHDLFNLRDCLVRNWRSPASFFIVNFCATSCKLPTPLTDVFDIHARLSIHFRQLAMNFDRFNAFCIQKPNYCSNFAPGGSSKQKLHYKRLLRQDSAS